MANYQPVPDDTMDEIIAGAGGNVENKAENAVSFLEEWSTWLVELINIFKNFFERISEAFKTMEIEEYSCRI